MSSGVPLHSECVPTYIELKLHRKYKYIIYDIRDKSEIVVDKTGEATEYETFIRDLPKDQCRWAVYDLDYEHEGGKRNKILFYSWSPETARTFNKMLFASSRAKLRDSLTGIAGEIQATEFAEADYGTVMEKFAK